MDQGDYSVPTMKWAKFLKKDPYFIASEICEVLKEDKEFSKNFSKIECAQPGYINFYISKENLISDVKKILNNITVNFTQTSNRKKINVEFISVNPTGELHIGHARGAFYGDVLCNVLSAVGYEVTREYYVNNAKHSSQIKSLGKTAKGEGEEYKTKYLDDKISLNKQSIDKINDYGEAGYFLSGTIQKDICDFLENRAKIYFDVWKEEEDFYSKNIKAIENTMQLLRKANLVYEDSGATWIKTSKIGGEKDDVLVRSNGDNTYFFADIAYHIDKIERGFDNLINIWGADHYGHIKRLCSALSSAVGQIDKNKKFQIEIITSQLVRIKGGEKLSKRKGNIITMEAMIDAIGIDVARYFYLVKSLKSQMEIDLDDAADKSNNNPVYYIQYTNARICSIIKKAQSMGYDNDNFDSLEKLNNKGEIDLMRKLIRVTDVVNEVSRNYQVHLLPSFVFDVAKEFNQFYRDYRVIYEGNINIDRLLLAKATSTVICSVLDIMGISHPESM